MPNTPPPQRRDRPDHAQQMPPLTTGQALRGYLYWWVCGSVFWVLLGVGLWVLQWPFVRYNDHEPDLTLWEFVLGGCWVGFVFFSTLLLVTVAYIFVRDWTHVRDASSTEPSEA